MSALEEARKAWLGRTDEWLYERLNEELKQKIEEIHRLIKENADSGYPPLSDVGELLDKIDELKKDFNPYNFCDYEKLLWGQILRLADKLRANVS